MNKIKLAYDLMDWHGGGGSSLYALGSNLLSEETGGTGLWDHGMVRDAIGELEGIGDTAVLSLTAQLKELITTKVIFRVFYKWGDVIAFFPEDASDATSWYSCSSYQHIGQHGAADYEQCLEITRPATKEEYTPLKQELESSPYYYIFKVCQKQTPQMRETRKREWKGWMKRTSK